MRVDGFTKRTKRIGLLLGAGLILGASSWAGSPTATAQSANAKNDLSISLTARKVVLQADGKEKLIVADRAFPGEVIQYDALYKNQSAMPVTSVAPTLPIPVGMVFVPESASPAPSEASLDGKKFEPLPIRRKLKTPGGGEAEVEVPAIEYRALRWNAGELAPGAKTTITARTRLLPADNR